MKITRQMEKKGIRPQVGLKPKERWSNVRGAFNIKASEFIKGKRIILVDDVLTTGATSNECARVLKKAGAARVEVLTLSRTLLGFRYKDFFRICKSLTDAGLGTVRTGTGTPIKSTSYKGHRSL